MSTDPNLPRSSDNACPTCGYSYPWYPVLGPSTGGTITVPNNGPVVCFTKADNVSTFSPGYQYIYTYINKEDSEGSD